MDRHEYGLRLEFLAWYPKKLRHKIFWIRFNKKVYFKAFLLELYPAGRSFEAKLKKVAREVGEEVRCPCQNDN